MLNCKWLITGIYLVTFSWLPVVITTACRLLKKLRLHKLTYKTKATGNYLELLCAEFPVGIPGNLWNSGGNSSEFLWICESFVLIFVAYYNILVINLTHYNTYTTARHKSAAYLKQKAWLTSWTRLLACLVSMSAPDYLLDIDIETQSNSRCR